MSANVNKFRVFTPFEIAAFILAAAAVFAAVFPEHTLTELVNREKNKAVTIKYLKSIIRVEQDNKYKFLLADTYMSAGLYSDALVTVNTIRPENQETLFRKSLYTLSLVEKRGLRTSAIESQIGALKSSISGTLASTKDTGLLELAYAQGLQARAYFAAELAADRLSGISGKNSAYWLEKAADACEKNNDPKKAAELYLSLARVDRELWSRRLHFKRAFDDLAAAGEYGEIKRQLLLNAAAFAGDKHTAATMLRYARMTGDAGLARRVALAILRGGAI